MLKIHEPGRARAHAWNGSDALPRQAPWLDLIEPTEAESAAVARLVGVPLPQRQDISGLGLSSRHHAEATALYLHAHLYADEPSHEASPLGFLVTRERLVTQRYADSRALDRLSAGSRHLGKPGEDGPCMLVYLLQAIANDVADQMQRIANDVASLSHDVFSESRQRTPQLHDKLMRVGRLEARLARFRISLLGIGRSVGFVDQRAPDWFDAEALDEIRAIARDLKTLDEFDQQLTEKLQFLQDAVLGFINTNQNSVMKLLTVASVVTIPPVILAGVWGMNFRHMPELDTYWGYPMALTALLVSMLVPLIWFGLRGWLSRD